MIREAYEWFASADHYALRRDACRPNTDNWYKFAAMAMSCERKGLALLVKGLGL